MIRIDDDNDETLTNLCQIKIPFLWSFSGNGEVLYREDCRLIFLLAKWKNNVLFMWYCSYKQNYI